MSPLKAQSFANIYLMSKYIQVTQCIGEDESWILEGPKSIASRIHDYIKTELLYIQ